MSVSNMQKRISGANKINMSLLKNLAKPLEESLTSLIKEVQDLQEDKIQVSSFKGLDAAHLITRSLEMIDAKIELKVAESIEQLAKKIHNHNIRGQQELYVSTNLLKNAATALLDHLLDVINNKPTSGIALWPVLSPMQRQLGFKDVKIESMYYPKPKFNNSEFKPIKKDNLKQLSNKLKEEFDEVVKVWLNSDNPVVVKKCLKQIAGISKQLYELKHRPGYQGYWLAVMGRLQIALLEPDLEMSDKEKLGIILDNMSVEILRFGEDSHKVTADSLYKAIIPLVREDIIDMAKYSSILEEIVERFDIDLFYKEAAKAMDSEKIKHKNEFLNNKKEIVEIINNLKKEWEKLLTSSISQNKKNLNNVLNILNGKKYLLPTSSSNLVSTIVKLKDVYTEGFSEKITKEVGSEVATGLIMLENIIDKNGEISVGLEKQVDIQIRRIHCAYEEDLKTLSSLPEAHWDEDTKRNEYLQTVSKVSTEIRKDIGSIEKALSDIFSGKPSPLSGKDMDFHFKMILGALKIMNEDIASKLIISIRNLIAQTLKKEDNRSQEEEELIIMGLSSILAFLDAKEKDDQNPVMKLAPMVEKLLGIKLVDETENDEHFNMKSTLEFVEENKPVIKSEPIEEVKELVVEEKVIATPVVETQEDDEDFTAQLMAEMNRQSLQQEEVADEEEEKANLPTYTTDALLQALENAPEAETVVEEKVEENSVIIEEPKKQIPYYMTEEDMSLVGVIDKSEDEYLAEIFIDELDMIIENLITISDNLNKKPNSIELIKDLKRQYHTLKGSGRMALFTNIGEVGWKIEHHINVLLENDTFEWDSTLKNLIKITIAYIDKWRIELKETNEAYVDASEILEALYKAEHKYDQLEPEVVVEPVIEPEVTVEPVVEPEVAVEPVVEPEVAVEPVIEPEVVVEPVIEPEVVVEPVIEPEVAVEPVIEPEVAVEPVVEPEVAVEPVVEPEVAVEPVVEPEIDIDLQPINDTDSENMTQPEENNMVKLSEDVVFTVSDFESIKTLATKEATIIKGYKDNYKDVSVCVVSKRYLNAIHDLHVLTQTVSFLPLSRVLSIIENKLYVDDVLRNESKRILENANESILDMLDMYLVEKNIPEIDSSLENKLQNLLTNEEDYNIPKKVLVENVSESNSEEESEMDKYWDEALDALTIMSQQMARFQEIMIKLSGKK